MSQCKISFKVIVTTFLLLTSLVASIIQLYSFKYTTVRPGDDLSSWATNYAVTSNDTSFILDDNESHIMWFVQVSDLHFSVVFDATRGPDFKKFCQQVIPSVKPSVTIVSGDLTDARMKGLMAGAQQIQEWIMYSDIINSTGVTKQTLWLDIRGNHDDFGVGSFEAKENYFAKYSVRGQRHRRHYSYYVEKGGDTYAFIAVDACLEPGPNRPFNTVGLLHPTDISALRALRDNATQLANYTVWFGHYPIAAINAPIPGLMELVNGPYLSGHIHQTQLYYLQPRGFLDIEVGDWRAKRIFRLAAIDHGLFSFEDYHFPTWPLILITNPKDHKFSMPKLENLNLIATSTHIRVLVFSTSSIASVTASIDAGDWVPMEPSAHNSPLYVLRWTPSDFKNGLHTLHIKAVDASGQQSDIQREFSLDGSKSDFKNLAKLILTHYHQTTAGIIFFLTIGAFILPLLLLRLIDLAGKGRCIRLYAKNHGNMLTHLVGKAYYMTCVDKVFLPVIGIPLYMTFGPWLVGTVIPDSYAICFVWGIIVDGTVLPGGISYILAALYIISVHSIEVICLTQMVNCRYRALYQIAAGRNDLNSFFNKYCNLRNLSMVIIYSLHMFFSYIYADAYGFTAWLFGMMHTWTLVILAFVWYQANNVTFSDFTPSCRPRSKKDASANRPLHSVACSQPLLDPSPQALPATVDGNDDSLTHTGAVVSNCMPKDESTTELLKRKQR